MSSVLVVPGLVVSMIFLVLNISLTESRFSAMMVKIPSMVPKGMNKHNRQAMTKQNV